MDSWGSWLRKQAATVAEGMQEFGDQLNDDTSDVKEEAAEKLRKGNEKVGATLNMAGRRLTDTLSTVADGEAIGQFGERLIERVDKLSIEGAMEVVEGALMSAEQSTSNLLARGAEKLRHAADGATGGTSAAPSVNPSAPSASSGKWFEERVRTMEADASFTQPPTDAGGFEQFCTSFELLAHTERIGTS